MACVIAIDAGTTGVRSLAVDEGGKVVDVEYREITQHFPRPAWVEHDPNEIWRAVAETLVAVANRQDHLGRSIVAIGVTNQRETVIPWDRRTGEPRHRAIVWQDRRTAQRCVELREAGYEDLVRERTGLVLDPYFSATKMEWLLREGGVEQTPDLVLATVDSWVLWNLTGGAESGVLATEPSNASRTMLLDINRLSWDEELCDLFGVRRSSLPELAPTCCRFGTVKGDLVEAAPMLVNVPVSGIAGDQQSALFGQACFGKGMAKATYGTGTFVLLNVGDEVPPPVDGLLTTVSWDLGEHAGTQAQASGSGRAGSRGRVSYALEGAIFATGSAIQWLRDGLGIISEAAEIGPLAEEVPGTDGVYVVPAFNGLGSPWWDPYARGLVTGITRGSGRAQLARAVVEAMAYQVRDVVDTMRASGAQVEALRVDGGASVMDLLLQLQADQIRVPVMRPTTTETTALGAATLAGLAEDFWRSIDELAGLWSSEAEYEPKATEVAANSAHDGWRRAVERALHWEKSDAREQ